MKSNWNAKKVSAAERKKIRIKGNFNFLREKTENSNSSARLSVEAGKSGIELDSFSKLQE
jgi:hypothetical protein